jgi:hypothetical protein
VQEHPLVAIGDTQQLSDVRGFETFHVAQHDHFALLVGEVRQQLVDTVGEALGDEAVVDTVRPRGGRVRPRTVAIEPFDVVVRLAGPLLAACGRPRSVQEDAEEPRLERRAPLEPLDATDNGQPGVLARLFRHGPAADGRLCEAEQTRLVPADELGERGLVASTQPLDETDITVHAR